MKVVMKKLTDLRVDPRNARKHDDLNLASIKAALKEFKQQKPIVIDTDGTIIAGNGTFLAAKELGWKQIQCVVSELDAKKCKAYAIADNRTAELAEWDYDQLLTQLKEMDEEMLASTGFVKGDLERLSQSWDPVKVTDPSTIPGYKAEEEMVIIKVTNVPRSKKDEVLALVKTALEGHEFNVDAY